MNTVRFDSVGGASGDMLLGTMVAAGVPAGTITGALDSLSVQGFRVVFEPAADGGHQGIRARVDLDGHEHAHRGLGDIRAIVHASGLDEAVKTLSMAVFERLAEAEAAVHGVTPESIHFHEVGAVDAIVDIVGACTGLLALAPDRVDVGPLPVGQGTVQCAHGVLPIPVPAVVKLLGDHPVVATGLDAELVTPTGAALLMTWKGLFAAGTGGAPAVIRAAGNGFGRRSLPGRANYLRATILETVETDATGDTCVVLECNLDDMNPELVGALCMRLMTSGALDVYTTAIQMKKQRPGILLTILCGHAEQAGLLDLVFTESTTFGVRAYEARRTMLERSVQEVETAYGPVRVKTGHWKGKPVTRAPEYDDCVARAETHNVPVKAVYEAALRAVK